MEGKEKTLFCPGIPGADKTMIASIAVDHLRTSFPDDKTGKAFLYCSYKRQDNQKVDDLLASLLGQLTAWQSTVPKSIRALYDEHRENSFDNVLFNNLTSNGEDASIANISFLRAALSAATAMTFNGPYLCDCIFFATTG